MKNERLKHHGLVVQGILTYPMLPESHLGIPATSVPTERAFSLAGQVENQKRSALNF